MKKLMTIAILAGVMVASTAAFGEDAYIENMGGQFLNTGYCVCTNTRIEIDFQLLEIASSKYILASYQGSQTGYRDNLACEIYVGFNGVEKFSFYSCTNGVLSGSSSNQTSSGLRKGTNLYKADTNRHVIVVDYTLPTEHFQVWNGDFKQKLASWTMPAPFLDNHRSTIPLALFGRCYRPSGIYSAQTTVKENTFSYSTKMKVYGLKIYEGGSAPENLVMHLVPHVKGGVAGFKDLCRPGRFVQGEIDGACTAGGDVTEEPDDPYVYSPRNTFSALSQKSVFLDTGYTVTPTTRVELDFALLKNWATNSLYNISPYLIGASGGSPRAFYFYAYGDDVSSGYFRYGAGGTGSLTECGIDAAYNIRRTVSMNSNSVSLITAGYTNATAISSSALSTDLTTYTLKIGSSWSGVSRFLPMKVYGLKIYESDELVKDYLPFYRNGVAGLTNSLDAADILTSRTYINSSMIPDGVHTNVVFDAGGHVTDDPVEKEAYLEFDGVNDHSINTEYAISKDSCIEVDFAPWKTTLNNNYFDVFGQGQGSSATSTIIWTRLYCGAAQKYNYYFADAAGSSPGGVGFSVDMNHSRVQVKLDGANSKATITSEGRTLATKNITATHTAAAGSRPLYIGGSYSGGTRCSAIRLYSLKISEAGTLARNFVPCMHEGQAGLYELCQGRFFALTGGKVYGKGYRNQSRTFEVSPQPSKITKGIGPHELACLAPGASSFEWYEDDKLIEGATTDSYTVEWTHKAPHMRTYKVVPIYSVFNEKVRGEAAEAQVELTPVGILIKIQ